MKKILAIIIYSFLIISCGEDMDSGTSGTCIDGIMNGEETGVDCGGNCTTCIVETTVEEDKKNIEQTFDDMLQCVRNLKNSTTADVFLRDFLNMSNGEVFNEDWIEELTEDLDQVIDEDYLEDNNRFSMAIYSGTYLFDFANTTWTKINNQPDKVIFLFPSEPGMSTNNVELVLDRYEDTPAIIDGDDYMLPNSLHAFMNINGNKVMDVDIKEVIYATNADFEIPVEITASVLVDPIQMEVKLDRISTTGFNFDFSMTDDELCVISTNVVVELKDDDFENLDENSFEKIEVRVNVGDMTFQSLAGLAELISLDDPSESVINSLIDLDVLYKGLKIADLEYDDDNETMTIFYKDLTFENSNSYYDDFLDELEILVREFTGNW